jgi:diacylglycerol kinase family enzyme
VLGAWLHARLDGYDTAVIAGGDGSLGVAYNAAAGRPEVTLGYIPAGFGNATAHLLRLPRDPGRLVAVLRAADARPIDLVAVDGRLGLFAGAGWDALVAGRYAAAGARRLPGWARAVVRSLPDLRRPAPVEVRADGWLVHRGPMQLAVIGTTPFYGRGLRVNPGARPNAGRLAMRVYEGDLRRFGVEVVRWVARSRPAARRVDATSVELRSLDGSHVPVQVDGDLLGARDRWTFDVRPAAVRLIGSWS